MSLTATTNETTDRAQSFMSAVSTLRALTAADLEAVNGEILARMQSSVAAIPEIASHLINAGGKRIRPMFTIAAARIFDFDGDEHVKLAASVELIHGATLLHDDVVDASSLRRGVKTANVIWGNKESVLVGDYIFSRAFELMVAAKNMRILQILSHASSVIAEGEVLQLSTQKNMATTLDMYIDVIDAKTAALFGAATRAGAAIADCAPEIETALYDFGRNFGIAYQLIDDALDYAGFESNLGKSVGDDFREGKMTLPLVYAVARAKQDEMPFWTRVISHGRQEDGDLERAFELMTRDDAIVDTIACAKQYAQKAAASIARAPQNAYSVALADLVETSVTRIS